MQGRLARWLNDAARKDVSDRNIVVRAFFAVVREVARYLVPLETGAMLNFIVAGVMFWAYDYYGDTKYFRHGKGIKIGGTPIMERLRDAIGAEGIILDAGAYFYWYACCFLMLMVVPLIVVALNPNDRVADYGLGLGNWKLGFSLSGVFIVIMLIVLWVFFAKIPEVQEYYPLFNRATKSWELFLYYELMYALYFVAWEFMFRGYMTFGLEKVIGKWAIFVQAMPFMILHFGKPSLEALSSIFGGMLLGWLALRTRSFWYGVFIHATMACALDFMVGVPRLMGKG